MISDEQYNILVNFMESHGNLTLPRGHLNDRAKEVHQLWDQLTCELNQAGQPLTRTEWAIAWYQLKRNLKKILTHHHSIGQLESFSLTPLQTKIRKIMGGEENINSWFLKKPEVPNSVKAYYATLYRENKLKSRKGKEMHIGDNYMLQREANESWKNLPAQYKQNIILKHKHARDLRLLYIADHLKDVDLNQLPAKPRSYAFENKDDQIDDIRIVDDVCDTDKLVEENPKGTNDSSNYLISNDVNDSSQIMDATMEDNMSFRSNTTRLLDEVEPPPPPPVVTTAEELYDLLQKSQEIEPKPWVSLPEAEKRQFRSAIAILKKESLRQYRSYLHNLSSAHLHKHMVQTLFSDII